MTDEAILRIQRMVAEGRISPEESVELIESIRPAAVLAESVAEGSGLPHRSDLARWGFRLFAGALGCGLLALSVVWMPWAWRAREQIDFLQPVLLLVGGAMLLVSYGIGRFALRAKTLPGRPVAGWRYFQAAAAVAVLNAFLLLLVFLGLPGGVAVAFDEMNEGYRLDGWYSVAGFSLGFAIITAIAAPVVRRQAQTLSMLFEPVLPFLRPEHARILWHACCWVGAAGVLLLMIAIALEVVV